MAQVVHDVCEGFFFLFFNGTTYPEATSIPKPLSFLISSVALCSAATQVMVLPARLPNRQGASHFPRSRTGFPRGLFPT